MKMKVNGAYVDDYKFIMNFVCPECGEEGEIIVKHNPMNDSLQVRCYGCMKFIGNFKYDFGGENDAASSVSGRA